MFNDLFCLRDPRVHTISVGASCPDDLVLHLDAVALLDQADALITPIEHRLHQAAREVLGGAWMDSWQQGLPHWQDTPGEMNLPLLLWLHNLLEAWDLEGFVKARYGLLGRGGHWFLAPTRIPSMPPLRRLICWLFCRPAPGEIKFLEYFDD